MPRTTCPSIALVSSGTPRSIISLNPDSRRQTRKYRAVLPALHQMVPLLNAAKGLFVPVISIRSAWDSMANAIGLPGEREASMS